ncbi:MAG: InlB B-repeat-containing protein [Clostridia bacterium]|nr:InlB B-repeat-containing protein [Clostridia bacterium]
MSSRARLTLRLITTLILICGIAIGAYFFLNLDDGKLEVTLDAVGTSLNETTLTPDENGKITLPTPTKDGYTFDGWYIGDTAWHNDMIVSEDMVLTAKWTIKKYNITFIVNGEPTLVQAEYNTMPSYTGELTKPDENFCTYTFSNWQPALVPVTKDATYTAVFSPAKMKFNVTLTSNIPSGGKLSGAGSYEHLTNVYIGATINNGYTFNGWYLDGQLYNSNRNFLLSRIAEHTELEARYTAINYTVTYHIPYDIENNNITSYTVLDPDFVLEDLSKFGSTFKGWYTAQHGGSKVTAIDTASATNYNLYARFENTNYAITYNLDGGTVSGHNASTYDVDTDTFTLINPTKPSHDFIGWTGTGIDTPTMVVTITKGSSGDRSYTAHYSYFNSYSVSLSSGYPGAGALTGGGLHREGSTVTISATVNDGYEFVGWYNGSTLYSNQMTVIIADIDRNIILTAIYTVNTYNISYVGDDGCTNANTTSFTVLDGAITLKDLSKTGYTFLGWYTEASGGSKVETISSLKNHTLYAHFDIITYSITYNLDDGVVSGTNKINYTVETDTFTIINPTKTDYYFLGWSGTDISGMSTSVTISKGSTGNRIYTANWKYMYGIITFKVGDNELDNHAIKALPGTSVSAPTILASSYNMTGYTLDGWYTDSLLTHKYVFDTMPEDDITLYGSWDYFLDEGFYPYLDEFSLASTTHTTEINSFDELVAFVEYIQFNYITDTYPFNIVYTTPTINLVSRAIDQSTYPRNVSLTYGTTGIKLDSDVLSIEAKYTADPTKRYVYDQQDNALLTFKQSNRLPSNTMFNIDYVNKTLPVQTSNQLMYALEKGLKPLCVVGSSAERMYNKAKTVLNSICDNTMNDFEKIKAIYDWMIMNVQYDQYAADRCISNWEKYDAWYLEGVFDKGVAVCDGISKALLVLAQIENIPAVRTTSTNHAWNKVYIDGKWYGIDATHGDLGIGDDEKSYLSYCNFLFTDSYKLFIGGQDDTQYDELVADTVYNYYDNQNYMYNGTEYDLEINSQAEFNALIDYYIKPFNTTTETFSFEVLMGSGFSLSLNVLFRDASMLTGFTFEGYSYVQLGNSSGLMVYMIIIYP